MKILHIIATLDAGGTEMAALRLIGHWRNPAVQQQAIVLSRSSGVIEAQLGSLIPYRVLSDAAGGATPWAIYSAVRKAAARLRPDAILIHTFGVHQLAALLGARISGVRRVAGAAGNPPPRDARRRRRWAMILLGSRILSCPIASCSRAVHQQLFALGVGMPTGSFAVAHGVELYPDAPQRTRPIIDIGMVARFDEIKDHDTLLRAFALVARRISEVRLSLIGDGPLRPELEARAVELGIADRVTFFGRRTDVDKILDTLDLFVFSTTHDEGFGIVLIEAMAKRLPIIATDVPACREVLDDGAGGVLVPFADPQAMADAILRLVERPGEARELADRGHARVKAEYSMVAAAGRWRKILRLP